ncbi:hypothetical protein ABD72_23325 [Brevibacillus laterosporus]|nr:hypothetical protein BrL25_00985 [Brevibacillus laterosporus DSM 25]MBG9804998.1 hypothetical protein [Brevibacillus laterosporus]MBM7109986.1 hypothetical protein [Brevibacillus laterosporus]
MYPFKIKELVQIWIVHQRMAELWFINKTRELTDSEMTEMSRCLSANAKKAWEIAKLKNLFLITSMTNDTEWQHELCARIGKIER